VCIFAQNTILVKRLNTAVVEKQKQTENKEKANLLRYAIEA